MISASTRMTTVGVRTTPAGFDFHHLPPQTWEVQPGNATATARAGLSKSFPGSPHQEAQAAYHPIIQGYDAARFPASAGRVRGTLQHNNYHYITHWLFQQQTRNHTTTRSDSSQPSLGSPINTTTRLRPGPSGRLPHHNNDSPTTRQPLDHAHISQRCHQSTVHYPNMGRWRHVRNLFR